MLLMFDGEIHGETIEIRGFFNVGSIGRFLRATGWYSIWYWRSILMSGYLKTLLNSFFGMISPPKIGEFTETSHIEHHSLLLI